MARMTTVVDLTPRFAPLVDEKGVPVLKDGQPVPDLTKKLPPTMIERPYTPEEEAEADAMAAAPPTPQKSREEAVLELLIERAGITEADIDARRLTPPTPRR